MYLAFCLFPFVLPCFAPTAVPQVLPFWISPPGSVPDFHFLSSASVLASHYSASVLPFPLLTALASQWASSVLLFRLHFPGFSPCFRPGFPCLLFRFRVLGFLFVSFRPSLFRSHSCSTGAHLFPSCDFTEVFSLAFAFLSSGERLGSDYSASVSSFPSSRLLPHSGSSGALIHRLFRLFPCFPSDFGTRHSCDSFLRSLFRITSATSAAGLLFPARPFPLAFALGSGYLAQAIHPEN